VADSLVAVKVCHEELASPHDAVGTEPEPVESDAEDSLGPTVLDEARSDMGMVVLDGKGVEVEVVGVFRREVLRVEIVDDDVRFDAVQGAQV
jgi:hypothetical protein